MYQKMLVQLALVASAVAVPLEKRAFSVNDQLVLNTALYLEHLEYQLYNGACNNFTDIDYFNAGYPYGFRQTICQVGLQEVAHISSITTGLQQNNAPVIAACSYNFSSVTGPTSFVNLANLIQTVSIGLYIGASQYLADSAATAEISASILAVQARQNAFLRVFASLNPFPAAFETAISPVWAAHLVQQFVTSCPGYLPLPVTPSLNLTGIVGTQLAPVTTGVAAGATLTVNYDPSILTVPTGTVPSAVGTTAPLYVAFVSQNIFSPTVVQLVKTGTGTGYVNVPSGIQGVVYVVLTPFSGTLSMDQLSNSGTLAGPVGLVVS